MIIKANSQFKIDFGSPARKSFFKFFFSIILTTLPAFSFAKDEANRPRRNGAILFKLKPGATINALLSQVGPFNLLDEAKKIEKIQNSGIYAVQFANPASFLNSIHRTEEQIASDFMKSGLVEYAEPDYVQYPDMIPNDALTKSQWYIEKLGLSQAWDVSTGSGNVQVLVCDTGVKSQHPDLIGNVLNAGFNFADNSKNTEPSGNAHGTLVAGLIGAKGNNGIGIAGINWNVKIIPGKISNDEKGAALTSNMVKCVQWAIDHQIRVVNLSYNANGSSALDDASKDLYNHNGLLVYTIGNTGQPVTYPKNPYALRVGATDGYDFKAYWSNTGAALDITAPGTVILSTDANGDYKTVKGTSFSAPLVAGAAALLMGIDPSLSAEEVRNTLLSSATDLGNTGFDEAFGWGRLDIGNAVQKLKMQKKLQSVKTRAIYGHDDRQELYEQNSMWKEIGRSLAGKVYADSAKNMGSYWQLSGALLKNKECPGRFAEQMTVPSCTGFLIKPNVLVTAAHCMKTAEDCDQNFWVFEYALANSGDSIANYTKVAANRVYKCKKVISQKYQDFGDIDYSIIELDRAVEGRQPLELGLDLPITPGQTLTNIGHSNGLPLKFKDSALVIQITPTGLGFDHDMDTFHGDSGSPVFDANTGKIIGITSRGHADHHHDGGTCRSLKVCNPGDKCLLSTASRISNLKEDPVFKSLFQ